MIGKRNIDPYLYANDGQLNVHLRIKDVNAALQNMETCVGDVQSAYNLTRQILKLLDLVHVTVSKS